MVYLSKQINTNRLLSNQKQRLIKISPIFTQFNMNINEIKVFIPKFPNIFDKYPQKLTTGAFEAYNYLRFESNKFILEIYNLIQQDKSAICEITKQVIHHRQKHEQSNRSVLNFEGTSLGDQAFSASWLSQNIFTVVASNHTLGMAEHNSGLAASTALYIHEIRVWGGYQSFEFVLLFLVFV